MYVMHSMHADTCCVPSTHALLTHTHNIYNTNECSTDGTIVSEDRMTDRSDHVSKSQFDVESTTVPNENNKENSEETKEMEEQGMCSCSGNLQKYMYLLIVSNKDNILQHDILCVLMMC